MQQALPAPSHRRIPLTEKAATERHGHRLRHSLLAHTEFDCDIGRVEWHYLVDEAIQPRVQKPYEDLQVRLEISNWRTNIATALPPEQFQSFLPIEIVDALLGESPRRRYHDKISMRDANGRDQEYLVVGGYCDARMSETSFNLMVVKPGNCLPAADAMAVPIFSEGDARIILGRDPVFASAAYMSAADGEEFVPDRSTGVRWHKMRTGWIQDAVLHAHGKITRRERAAGLR